MNNRNVDSISFFTSIFHSKHNMRQSSENTIMGAMNLNEISLNHILNFTYEEKSETPLSKVSHSMKLTIAIGFIISLLVGSVCKAIMYLYMVTTSKNNRGWIQRPINVLTIVSALTHHITHLTVGIWYILTLLNETPLAYIFGSSSCKLTQIVGLYGLGYLNVGGLGIAVYRILYMKHEHFVKYVIGEKPLLWIILSAGLILTALLVYLFTIESSSTRFHMNICYGWSVRNAEIMLNYE